MGPQLANSKWTLLLTTNYWLLRIEVEGWSRAVCAFMLFISWFAFQESSGTIRLRSLRQQFSNEIGPNYTKLHIIGKSVIASWSWNCIGPSRTRWRIKAQNQMMILENESVECLRKVQ